MQRRSFIGALLGAAGLAGVTGAKAVADVAPKALPPKPTNRSLSKASESAEMIRVREMLGKCRVINFERATTMYGIDQFRIVYRYAPNAAVTDLDRQASEIHAKRHIVSVNVSCNTPIDDDFADWMTPKPVRMPKDEDYEIEVEYL